jgi:hypothetical protein
MDRTHSATGIDGSALDEASAESLVLASSVTGLPLTGPMSWLIVLALNGVAIALYQTPIARVEALSQWLTPLTNARVEFLVEAAYTGERAGPRELDRLNQRMGSLPPPEQLANSEGYAVWVVVRGHPGGWMRWRYLYAPGSPVSHWSCVSTADAPDDLPREWLPPVCWTSP